jgi:hypothetical protein
MKRQALQSQYQQLVSEFPDADEQLKELLQVLRDIENVAGCTPASAGDRDKWSSIVSEAVKTDQNYCQVLTGKNLFSALHGIYTVALLKLKAVLKASSQTAQSEETKSSSTQEDGFKEVRRRKRHGTNEDASTSKKKVAAAEITPPKEVVTRNFFAPLRTSMETDSARPEAAAPEEAVSDKAGRPPPIILTSSTNLIQLHKKLKDVV